MLPDEVRKAVEYLDDLILNYHNFDLLKWQTIRAHLLAREAEVEFEQKRSEERGRMFDREQRRRIAAEALLRELRLRINETRGPNAFDVLQRVDAHLSENSRG
ncbi:hypothetical protein [Frateuria terrea]|uniref:Uncharacterized protein n=1 Tax=Frateuria terrea TaxID=529704 RepID=A0A1H7A0M0_9GAMM|nr:hypothetical protein [Frateuria terrea]SEJ54595.1 hypothetical protein SAMN04487997_0162 [Frateuria terrea]SFP47851.1 hypothetical protein SAMN02927913_2228 [Frateuria terrea]